MRLFHAALWAFLAGSTACGRSDVAAPLDPLEACRASAEINCARAYECLEAPERELLGFPADPDDCLAQLEQACAEEPAEEFCADGEIYQPDPAGECMAETRRASCQQIFAETAETWAPACAEMCSPAS
jgi:hypothetical protein